MLFIHRSAHKREWRELQIVRPDFRVSAIIWVGKRILRLIVKWLWLLLYLDNFSEHVLKLLKAI